MPGTAALYVVTALALARERNDVRDDEERVRQGRDDLIDESAESIGRAGRR